MPSDAPVVLDDAAVLHGLSDAEILDALCRQFGDYIYSLACSRLRSARLCEDDIRDCYCWVILQLSEKNCRRLRQFRGASAFKTFLTVTCGRLVIDYLRTVIRHERRIELVDDFTDTVRAEGDADDPEMQFLIREREALVLRAAGAVQDAVEGLGDHDRLLFRLRVHDRLPYGEIDRFLGIDNSAYRFRKIVASLRGAVDGRLRRDIEDLLAES